MKVSDRFAGCLARVARFDHLVKLMCELEKNQLKKCKWFVVVNVLNCLLVGTVELLLISV